MSTIDGEVMNELRDDCKIFRTLEHADSNEATTILEKILETADAAVGGDAISMELIRTVTGAVSRIGSADYREMLARIAEAREHSDQVAWGEFVTQTLSDLQAAGHNNRQAAMGALKRALAEMPGTVCRQAQWDRRLKN